jgi:hypothetical protein
MSSSKIALCFIINYEHVVYKENIWKKWIQPNKDIINVYFFYKDLTKIKSKWIYEHTIPKEYLCKTTYYHVVPAYMSLLNFALKHDSNNKWFCYLTDSCCPIITPSKFRRLFEQYQNHSIMKYSAPYWNINFHRRANLILLQEKYHLANDPWFVLTRENAMDCINFVVNENKKYELICEGGMANESVFAIALMHYDKLGHVKSSTTHMVDWLRRSSSTSPHFFKEGNEADIKFIDKFLRENEFVMFIRKVHPTFPDEILEKYIYNMSNDIDVDEIDKKNNILVPMRFSLNDLAFLCFFFLLYLSSRLY